MSKILWALAALSHFACTGNGPEDGSDGSESGGNTDDPRPGTGGLNVHAVYGGSSDVCQVIDENGDVLGNTEENILGLEPGQFNFALGDPDMTTLDGVPYHITKDGDLWADFTTGSGAVEVMADEVVNAEVELKIAPQYHCSSFACAWPYEGGTCDSELDEGDQWIYLDDGNVLRGSMSDSFAGVSSGLTLSLVDNVLMIVPEYETTTIVEAEFNPNDLGFGYTFTDDDFQSSAQVICSLL